LVIAGCAATPEQMAEAESARAAELADALDGYSPGVAQDCMPIDRTNGPQIIGGGVVLYRESGRRIWLSRDIPSLNLLGNRFYRIDPDALLYLGDPVAVRTGDDRVMVAPYQDDLLASVVGRVVA
jgi:hypothetical protein